MDREIRDKIRDAMASAAGVSGMTQKHAREHIELQIRRGLNSSDPEVRAFWRRIPAEGKYPTAEEAVGYLAAVRMGLID